MTAIATQLVQALPSQPRRRSEFRGEAPRGASGRNMLLWIGIGLATVLVAMS